MEGGPAGDNACASAMKLMSPQGGFCHRLKKERKGPFLIGVAGGTASGKSSVCKKIVEDIKNDLSTRSNHIFCLSTEIFYRDLNLEESESAKKGNFNFDHPDAFDVGLFSSTLRSIRERRAVDVPKYDYRKNARIANEFIRVEPTDVVIVEGILAFYWPEIRNQYDMLLFVDTDADTRLARRVKRDISERGRTLDTILKQYISTVKPAFEEFCLPTKKFADVIIPRGADNTVAIDLIVQSIKDVLANESKSPTKPEQAGDGGSNPGLVKRNSDSQTVRLH
ncbi:uridine-cytidine kinase-like [Watersipora subatra]|uniref:uridine-cytidine kinase-like n=1 Tax=Watersipora subatra TaxID=2589382 RepID=UPI00355AE445